MVATATKDKAKAPKKANLISLDVVKRIHFHVEGRRPFLMHSSELVDDASDWVIKQSEITAKASKKRTEEDKKNLRWLEFRGGMYWSETLGAVVPSHMIFANARDGARASRKGKDVERGIECPELEYKLIYPGHKKATPESLFADPSHVDRRRVCVNKGSSVMRTRARFDEWSVEFDIDVFPGVVDPEDVIKYVRVGGVRSGYGDYRPRFGLFSVISATVLEDFHG